MSQKPKGAESQDGKFMFNKVKCLIAHCKVNGKVLIPCSLNITHRTQRQKRSFRENLHWLSENEAGSR